MEISDLAVFFQAAIGTFELETNEGYRVSINVFGIFHIPPDALSDETEFIEEPVSVHEWGPGSRCVLTLRNPARMVEAECRKLYGVSIAVVDLNGMILHKHATETPMFPNGGLPHVN